MSESAAGGWRARVTDENAVIVTTILVALPAILFIDDFFGGATSVVFVVTLAVATVPGIAYSSHWPRSYSPPVAALFGLVGAGIVLAVMVGLIVALESVLTVDGAALVAFLVVTLTLRFGAKLLK